MKYASSVRELQQARSEASSSPLSLFPPPRQLSCHLAGARLVYGGKKGLAAPPTSTSYPGHPLPPVLLFSQMTNAMILIEDYLVMKGFKYLRLDGETKTESRPQMIQQLNAPYSDIFIFILSTLSPPVILPPPCPGPPRPFPSSGPSR